MALYNFHRVLICAAILFFFVFGLWSLKRAGIADVALGIGSWVASIATTAYLIYFNSKIRVLNQQR